MKRWAISACVAACAVLGGAAVSANMQSNRWFYEVTQHGRDVHFTLQLIEDDPPNFETTFMLTRGGQIGGVTLFKNKQFVREEADETVEPGGCIEDSETSVPVADCDSDGAAECEGYCSTSTAYRYKFVDKCVLDNSIMYDLYDESTFLPDGGIPSTGPESEGYFYIFDLMPTDGGCDDAGTDADTDADSDADTDADSDADADGNADADTCQDTSDSSCSASPGIGASPEGGLAALMLLIGLGGAVVARRRRAR
jgi:MYXO-CTERM domain-containing protein